MSALGNVLPPVLAAVLCAGSAGSPAGRTIGNRAASSDSQRNLTQPAYCFDKSAGAGSSQYLRRQGSVRWLDGAFTSTAFVNVPEAMHNPLNSARRGAMKSDDIGAPCTPLGNLTVSVGNLSPQFSNSFCGHSYVLDLSNATETRMALGIFAADPSISISVFGVQGAGGVGGLPGVATSLSLSGTGFVSVPLIQLVQNVTEVNFVLQPCGLNKTYYHLAIKAPRFRFASTFGDHMVLHRAPLQASIFGFGIPGKTITLTLRANTSDGTTQLAPTVMASGHISPAGTWNVLLPPVAASAPFEPATVHTLCATSGGVAIEVPCPPLPSPALPSPPAALPHEADGGRSGPAAARCFGWRRLGGFRTVK
eukprot:SAG11_NODE_1873_length_4150_cov_1.815354_4_plen_365_part_00